MKKQCGNIFVSKAKKRKNKNARAVCVTQCCNHQFDDKNQNKIPAS